MAFSCLTLEVVVEGRIRAGTPVSASEPICPDSSGRLPNQEEDVHLHCETARQVAEAAVESALARFQRTGSARRWDGTFFTVLPMQLTGSMAATTDVQPKRM